MPQDSPLSITASVIGILTFVGVVALWFYAHFLSLLQLSLIDYEIVEIATTVIDYFQETITLMTLADTLNASSSEAVRAYTDLLVNKCMTELDAMFALSRLMTDLVERKTKRRDKNVRTTMSRTLKELESVRSRMSTAQFVMLWA
jgi:hypothetical protein